jgi:hypothetical protein
VAVAVLLLAAPAFATVLADLSIEDMAFDSDAIVIGRVVHVGTRLELGGGHAEPWTVTTIRAERFLAGGETGSGTVVIEERGGTLQDGSGMRVAGTPEYREGERVLVFLKKDPAGRFRTYGMVMGRFVLRASVDGPTRAVRDMDDVALAHWSNGQMQVAHGGVEELALDDLLARIDLALGARR